LPEILKNGNLTMKIVDEENALNEEKVLKD